LLLTGWANFGAKKSGEIEGPTMEAGLKETRKKKAAPSRRTP
jgi:hypothetical protein